MVTAQRIEFIDWTERYPAESSLETAIRQSTYCPCGKPKQIGDKTCGHDSRIVSFWYRGSTRVDPRQGNGRQTDLEQDIREFEVWQRKARQA